MSSNIPEKLLYSKEHEWILVEDNCAMIGITDFAQSSLGDIVFVELPEEDRELEKDESFGVVESIKSVSDLYSPVAGKVIEINSDLEGSPDSINSDPYGSWMVKIEIKNQKELEDLMNAQDYLSYCQG